MKTIGGRRTDSQKESRRRTLLEKRAQVLSNLGVKFDTRAALGRVAEDDQAQLTHEEFISLSLNNIDYEQLGLIDEALDRLRTGDYGVCQACGDPIPSKRLDIVPWALYCVPCQDRPASSLLEEPEPVVGTVGN